MLTVLIWIVLGILIQHFNLCGFYQFVIALVSILFLCARVWCARSVGLIIILLVCGFLFSYLNHSLHSHVQLPDSLLNKPVFVTGKVVGLPIIKKNSVRLTFDTQTINDSPCHVRVLLIHYPITYKFKSGELWQFSVKLKSLYHMHRINGFDYGHWLLRKGYAAAGYVVTSDMTKALEPSHAGIIDSCRQAVRDFMLSLPIDRSLIAILLALTIGDRGLITASQWRVFQATGTSHLMAISGLHIGLFAMVGYVIFLRLTRLSARALLHCPAHKIAGLGSVIFAAIYALFSGFSYPAQRALLMIVCLVIPQWCDLYVSLSVRLLWAFVLIVVCEPSAVDTVGFWLSFQAVGCLCCAAQMRSSRLPRWIHAQYTIFIGMMPMVIGFFSQFSVIAPVVNVIALPVISFVILPLALFGCFSMVWAPAVAAIVLQGGAIVLSQLWHFMSFMATFHWALWSVSISPAMLCALSLSVLLLFLPKGVPGRYLYIGYGGAALLGLIFK